MNKKEIVVAKQKSKEMQHSFDNWYFKTFTKFAGGIVTAKEARVRGKKNGNIK